MPQQRLLQQFHQIKGRLLKCELFVKVLLDGLNKAAKEHRVGGCKQAFWFGAGFVWLSGA